MAFYPREPPPHRDLKRPTANLPHVTSTAPQSGGQASRRYYGIETLARLSSNWLKGVMGCPDIPLEPPPRADSRPKPLKDFIAHILRRTRLDSAVVFCALYNLNRLKESHPALKSSSGHALFFAALIVTAKTLLDWSYSNKDLASTTEGMYPLRTTNQLERELLKSLEWAVRPPDVESSTKFEEQIYERYNDGPQPWIGSSRFRPTGAVPGVVINSHNYNFPSYRSRPLPQPPSQPPCSQPPVHPRPPPRADTKLPPASSAAHVSNHASRYPDTPDTPFSSLSLYESPPATPMPITPADDEDPGAARRIVNIPLRDKNYICLPGDACFGSVAPRVNQRRLRVQDI